MSMNDEILSEEVQQQAAESVTFERQQTISGLINFDKLKSIFLTEASPEPIEKFQDSPLCFDKSEGLAQMLKALAGWLGANMFNLAIIHFIVGLMKWTRRFKEGVKNG